MKVNGTSGISPECARFRHCSCCGGRCGLADVVDHYMFDKLNDDLSRDDRVHFSIPGCLGIQEIRWIRGAEDAVHPQSMNETASRWISKLVPTSLTDEAAHTQCRSAWMTRYRKLSDSELSPSVPR